MKHFLFLMHRDTFGEVSPLLWPSYLSKLKAAGAFAGGGMLGTGKVIKKDGTMKNTDELAGFIRIQAEDLEAAKALAIGNPIFECGGSIEIRELPQRDPMN
jgi:hypothetical protein